jgi:acyl-CoA thioesterase
MDPVEDADKADPFAKFLGIRVLESSEGKGKAVMPVREDFLQQAGVVQGGLVATLADHVLYLAVRSLLSPEETSVTVELKVNFISPARDGDLIGQSHVVSRGNRIVVGDMEVTDHRGTLIARGMGTCLVRRRG